MGISVALLTAMGVVIGLVFREVYNYRATRETYSLRRLTIRLCTGGMLTFLLGSIFSAIHFPTLYLIEPEAMPDLWLTFWGSIALLTGGIFFMLIADFRLLTDTARQNTTRLWREIAETIATHEMQKRQDKAHEQDAEHPQSKG